MRFDLSGMSIPLLTTKKMHTRSIIHEIIWYLQGNTNIGYLNDNNVTIWDEWADENGDLGPIYGAQWRAWKKPMYAFVDYKPDPPAGCIHWEKIDQIANVIQQLRTNPNDRRIIVNAWNVGEIDEMALPPCHAMFQFWSAELLTDRRVEILAERYPTVGDPRKTGYTDMKKMCDTYKIPTRGLRCHLYQRSCDVGLGVPFNIVQYSILTHMIAHVTNHVAEEFVWTGGDVHIYNNHVDPLRKQLGRPPMASPTLSLSAEVKEIDEFTFDDINIVGYESHPTIKMEVSV
jgi:thymidylate synthase